MRHVIHGKLGEGRQVAIPAELCQRYGLRPGDQIVLETSDDGIMVRPLNTIIREMQAFCADFIPKDGGYLSDELIRERQDEAVRQAHV